MAHGYYYFQKDFIPLSEYIPPSRVCIDNETCDDCTLIKVDGANRCSILLEVVQVISDLDLIITKAYISSDDGEWFMDVFHIIDQHGLKLRDPTRISFIQQSLEVAQNQTRYFGPAQVKICQDNIVIVDHFTSDCTALEITFIDRPGILSEVAAILFDQSYTMDSGEVWEHNGNMACILYIKEQDTGLPIYDQDRLIYLGDYLASVMKAHHFPGELWEVQFQSPIACQIHTERRLHQLMQNCMDYEVGPPPLSVDDDKLSLTISVMEAKRKFDGGNGGNTSMCRPQVSIDSWNERDYLVVNVRSIDRPKLMFDTVCALTNLDYDILHGSVSSHGSMAVQEYFIRQKNGYMMLNDMEKESVVRSLASAIERRMSRGLKMEVRTLDRHGLLSDVTRALRENSLSLNNVEFSKEDDMAVGTFYITDASSTVNPNDIDQQILKTVCNDIGRGIFFEKKNDSVISLPARKSWNLFSAFHTLGKRLWSHIKRFFSNFSFIR